MRKMFALLSLMVVFSMALSACGPTSTPAAPATQPAAPAATQAPGKIVNSARARNVSYPDDRTGSGRFRHRIYRWRAT